MIIISEISFSFVKSANLDLNESKLWDLVFKCDSSSLFFSWTHFTSSSILSCFTCKDFKSELKDFLLWFNIQKLGSKLTFNHCSFLHFHLFLLVKLHLSWLLRYWRPWWKWVSSEMSDLLHSRIKCLPTCLLNMCVSYKWMACYGRRWVPLTF